MTETDQSGGATQQEKDAVLSLCADCDFVEATVVDDYEDTLATEDDPAFGHHHETGHNTGSFQPAKQLAEQWGLLFTGYEGAALYTAEKLWELATGEGITA